MLSVSFAALAVAAAMTPAAAQQVAVDNNDIGGVVTGANGPEAGVWVIAETRDLPTRYIKIVDDRRSRPLCDPRSAARELTTFGSAAMGWWIRRSRNPLRAGTSI